MMAVVVGGGVSVRLQSSVSWFQTTISIPKTYLAMARIYIFMWATTSRQGETLTYPVIGIAGGWSPESGRDQH
jgi:hypothetical protein